MFYASNGRLQETDGNNCKSLRLRVTEIDKSVITNAFPGKLYPSLFLNDTMENYEMYSRNTSKSLRISRGDEFQFDTYRNRLRINDVMMCDTQVTPPSEHHVQTNAPEYQKILKEKNLDGLATTSKLRGKLQEFSTPKPSLKGKAKVIHKEKLNIPSGTVHSVSPNNSFTNIPSARSETAPVAHVHPSPALVPRESHGAEELGLKRSASTDYLTRALAEAHIAETRLSVDGLWDKTAGARRWNSIQNIADEYSVVPHDTDPTLLDPSQFREAEDVFGTGSYHSMPRSVSSAAHLANSESNLRPMHRDSSLSNSQPSLSAKLTSVGATAGNPIELPYGHISGKNLVSGGTTLGLHSHTQRRHSEDFVNTSSDIYSQYNRPPTYGGAYSRHGASYDSGYSMGPAQYSSSHGTEESLANDITSWQQKHQEQLRQQQMEISRPVYGHGSSHLSQTAGSLTTGVPVSALLDPHRLDAVKRAADSIIREKDMIIERQKLQLMRLEKHSKESESQVQQVNDFKLQELQYENASLKAQLNDSLSRRTVHTTDSFQWEKKLGQTEHEFKEYKRSAEKELKEKELEVKILRDKLKENDSSSGEWKKKYKELKSDYEMAQKNVERMQQYMADLPTADEHCKRTQEIQTLKHDKSKYKSRAQELDRRLGDANKAVKSREDLIESLEQADKELNQQIEDLRGENKKLQDKLNSDLDMMKVQKENEHLHELNERLKTEYEKARKILESNHKKLQSLETKHQREKTENEERLSQEEAAVTALREDLDSKDQLLGKLRTSTKELGSQNQDLMSKNLVLQDRIKELEKQHSAEVVKLEQLLMRQLGTCFAELESVVQVCVQRAEGQDPNISRLLGPKPGASHDAHGDGAQDSVQSLKHKVARVKELRKEVDDLKGIIANKYAEDMGDNLNCTTQ